MLGRNSNDGELSEKERLDRQEEQQAEARQAELANRLAAAGAREVGPAAPGYWETISDPDVTRDEDDELGDLVASELSSVWTRGYFRYSDWESLKWRIEYEEWLARNEFRDPDCSLDAVDMAGMYGQDKPVMTNERARRLRQTGETKKMMASLSIEGRGIKSGTEIHAVTRNEDGEGLPREEQGEPGDNGGRLSGAIQWLSR